MIQNIPYIVSFFILINTEEDDDNSVDVILIKRATINIKLLSFKRKRDIFDKVKRYKIEFAFDT
jgi:hypothetical protein